MRLPRRAPRAVYEVFQEHEYLEASPPQGTRAEQRSVTRVTAPVMLALILSTAVGLIVALSLGRRARSRSGVRAGLETARTVDGPASAAPAAVAPRPRGRARPKLGVERRGGHGDRAAAQHVPARSRGRRPPSRRSRGAAEIPVEPSVGVRVLDTAAHPGIAGASAGETVEFSFERGGP
jgi:hypothetical protein